MKTHNFTINLIAACATYTGIRGYFYRFFAVLSTAALFSACATPQPPVAKAVYDFGPPAQAAAALPTGRTDLTPNAPALALMEIEATPALDGSAVLYRLEYADALQLRPYTLARWSMPPARLVQQRLRDALAARRPVLQGADGGAAWQLKLELDEFSQWFDSPGSSAGMLRLRATLLRAGQLVAQRSFDSRASAPSADAPGGVRALAAATDDAAQKINAWLAEQVK